MSVLSLKYKTKAGTLAAPGDVDPGAFIPIATTTLSTATATISFTAIPQNYEHLQIRLFAQTNQGNNGDGVYYRLNGDSANNYTLHWLYGDGATASALGLTPYSALRIAQIAGDYNQPNPSSYFGVAIVDILDYANTNKYKTGRALSGYAMNGAGAVSLTSGVWMNTAAVTSITMTVTGGTAFKQYTHAALYGIKRAGA